MIRTKFEDFKKKKLEDITDEVNQFHPLLKSLFEKMSTINRVEYTHGNSEMGADFVLSTSHSVLKTERYIGVVVKVGKITQNVTDVERQVSECSIPRNFENGKKEVYLDEIWVVSNNTISNNAKTVIKNNSQLRSVEFLSGNEIRKLIDENLPNYWTNLPLLTNSYLTELRERNLKTEQQMSLLSIEDKDFYVEQDIYENRGDKFDKEREFTRKYLKVNIFEQLKRNKITLIEGGMGTGKSRLLRHLVAHFTTPEVFQDTNVLPILVSYKDFIDNYSGIPSNLISEVIDSKLQSELEVKTTTLILIDGVDEKKFSTEEESIFFTQVLENLRNTDKVNAVITTRQVRGFDEIVFNTSLVKKYEIRPLSITKVVEFIKSICKRLNITQRILEDLKRSKLFRDLPKSPISAILLAKLLNEQSQELPSNMTELYSKYTEIILGKWDIDKGLQSTKEYEALNTFFMDLAEYFIENELIQISVNEARERLSTYLSKRNLGIDIDSLMSRILNGCEIIAHDDERGVLRFKHKTFAEFLFSKKIIKFQKLQIDERAFASYWNNVIYFCVGLLKDCPEVLEQLISYETEDEGELISRFVNLPNYFLAGFASPYEVISGGIEKLAVESSKYYCNVIHQQIDSIFLKFPRMFFLMFINHLIEDGLSFEFFKDGIETSALSIANSSEINDEQKAYALFFLNVAYIKLGVDQDFTFLLDKFKNQLPVDLLFAVDLESKKLKVVDKSKILQKQNKKFKSLLKGNANLNREIQSLINKPISDRKQK